MPVAVYFLVSIDKNLGVHTKRAKIQCMPEVNLFRGTFSAKDVDREEEKRNGVYLGIRLTRTSPNLDLTISARYQKTFAL